MNKFRLLLIALLISPLMGMAQGIEFNHKPWNEVLEEARTSKKPIFVDAYTSWCGPCKKMARDVFTQKIVGDFFNKNYICVKMDMEVGEGIEMAQREAVNLYPTYLYYSSEGELIHRAVGYIEAEQFIAEGKNAMDPNKQFSAMERKFNKGERGEEFLYNYAYALSNIGSDKGKEVAEAYLEVNKDWKSERASRIIMEFAGDPDGKPFNYMVENRADFEATYGKDGVDNRIAQVLSEKAVAMSLDNDMKVPDEVTAMYVKYLPTTGTKVAASFKTNFYRMTEQWDLFAQAADEFCKDPKSLTANELNMIAWSFYEQIDDKNMLKKAVKWAKISVEKDRMYYNLDTYAALLYKTGKYKDAKKIAEQAIAKGKEEGQDTTETESLLDKIKAKK